MVEIQQSSPNGNSNLQSSVSPPNLNLPLYSNAVGTVLRFKDEPWCGKHLSEQESNTNKNVYNYAVRNKNAEKTPMCRIAELARYHKLKHEYVLLDESGPAHKKQFTVKLVLKPDDEYEGSGPSIKKAQQSAAENALIHTDLTRPPRKPNKTKSEANPVWLLYSVAQQVGLSVRFETQPTENTTTHQRVSIPRPPHAMPQNHFSIPQIDCGIIIPPMNCPPPPIHPSMCLMQSFSSPATPPNGFVGSQMNNKTTSGSPFSEQTPEILCRPPMWPTVAVPSFSAAAFAHHIPPPMAQFYAPTPLIQQRGTQYRNGQQQLYKCSFFLSDGSEHRGQGRSASQAKVDAALHALFHLRPLLSAVEAKLKTGDEQDEKKTEESTLVSKENVLERALAVEDRESPDEDDGPILLGNLSNDSTDSANEDENDVMENGGQENEVERSVRSQRRPKSKSVVSQIHECAYRLKMNVEFEVLRETGEPHNRRYVIRCSLSSPRSTQPLVADGEGSSKKTAKQNACQLMLDKVANVENDPVYLASSIVRQSTKKVPTVVAKETKRKTIIKDMKMDPLYGHHINPISRLIQVMQIRKEPEPVFRLVGERGQNRYREFVIEVTCMGNTQTGVGPNKKLAKRAAAVAMLDAIGYAKPMPQPGKSLLKKRLTDALQTMSEPPVEIGVFDPTTVFVSSTAHVADLQFDSNETVGGSEVTFGMFEDVNQQTRTESSSSLTFVDIDNTTQFNDQTATQDLSDSPIFDSPTAIRGRSDSEQPAVSSSLSSNDEPQPIRSQRRRVTFSNQVEACPPPEDARYPEASIAPLKSEVVLVTKLKKRGRDSKKALSSEEKCRVAAACRLFVALPNGRKLLHGYVPIETPITPIDEFNSMTIQQSNGSTTVSPPTSLSPATPNGSLLQQPYEIRDAKCCLERLARAFKFTVSYSDFPKAAEESFSLVTIGLDRPILRHGAGPNEDAAHNDAAYNAILEMTGLDSTVTITPPMTPSSVGTHGMISVIPNSS
ncbi:hypothetical protein M3Y95_00442700 [Aphelenchoides besseyi]|nr:hypothetical protein M3Y95_00442700 [Aphelenchoides besseyi]